jgi:hypothetical protein
MNDDRITRIDTNTGEATGYHLPRKTNVRRAFVHDRGDRPVFWLGYHHQASIVELQPLD